MRGLKTNPLHQAADILFCQGNVAPGGMDQLLHVEVTRLVVRRITRLVVRRITQLVVRRITRLVVRRITQLVVRRITQLVVRRWSLPSGAGPSPERRPRTSWVGRPQKGEELEQCDLPAYVEG